MHKGLRVSIYRASDLTDFLGKSDCTMNGLTSVSRNLKYVTVIDPKAPQIFEPDADAPPVRIVRRMIGGREYVHAEPIPQEGEEGKWLTAGGNFIHTSDSRFSEITGHQYPIAVHDRHEGAEGFKFKTTL